MRLANPFIFKHYLSALGVVFGLCALACGGESGNNDKNNTKSCLGTTTVCDPDNAGQILKVNSCGQVVEVSKTCATGQVCQDTDPSDPDRPITPRCGNACGNKRARLVCDASDPNTLFYVNECGELSGETTKCGNAGMRCVPGATDADDAICQCQPTEALRCFAPGANYSHYQTSYITYKESCGVTDEVQLSSEFLVETCDWGSSCFQEDDYNGGQPECTRSIDASASDSPYYNHSCDFPMFMRTKTRLEVDCRCRVKGDGGMGSGVVLPISKQNPGNAIAGCLSVGEGGTKAPSWRQPLIEDGAPMGSGVSVYDHWEQAGLAVVYGGFLDPMTRELYAPITWTNQVHRASTTIFAYNIDTGARRVVSGIYLDKLQGEVLHGGGYLSAQNAGDDQPLTGHTGITFGPDRKIYSVGTGVTGQGQNRSAEIVRTDPQTGDRELVWRSQTVETGDLTATYGQCLRHGRSNLDGFLESVAIQSRTLAVAPDGTFYLTFHGPKEGDGVLAISADGKNCRFVSRWNAEEEQFGDEPPVPAPDDIGGGFKPQYGPLYGALFRNDHIYTKTVWGDFIKVNSATGDRVVVTSKADSEDGTPGEDNLFYDSTRDLIFAIGNEGKHEGAVIDEKTNRIDSFFYDHAIESKSLLRSRYGVRQSIIGPPNALANANTLGHGAFGMDPDDNDIFYFVISGGALVKFERSTFNNYIMSL